MPTFPSSLPDFMADDTVRRLPDAVQLYVVGGAVRDRLMNRKPHDRDWVVVGASPELMVQAGFLPVGANFPVFLHPHTHEEYALARTECKTAPGYQGFSFYAAPGVTLIEDLSRRDFTINAMAMDASGCLIDPFDGAGDIERRQLRHVGPAFVEDPVRILRLGRFAARFGDFSIDPATLELCKTMVAQGEVDALVAERIWQELSQSLMEDKPTAMFEVLKVCGAWNRLTHAVVQYLALAWVKHYPGWNEVLKAFPCVEQRWAAWALLAVLGHGSRDIKNELLFHDALAMSWKIPNDVKALGHLVLAQGQGLAGATKAESVLDVLEACDALRKPLRWREFFQVVHKLLPIGLSKETWETIRLAVANCDLASTVQNAKIDNKNIKLCVRQARLDVVLQLIQNDCP